MLAKRRASLPKRNRSQRASAGADIIVGSPQAHQSAHTGHGSDYHASASVHHHHHHHRAVSELSRHARAGATRSDPNLARRSSSDFSSRLSSLSVGNDEYTIGQSESIVVFWDIREPVSASDWIGLYREDETNPFNYLEYKTQGENRSHVGQITWDVSCDLPLTEDVTSVCFKYYGGSTGVLRTTSPSFRLRSGVDVVNGDEVTTAKGPTTVRSDGSSNSPADCIVFRLTSLRAFGLKKGIFFNPDPYVKMSVCPWKDDQAVLPHHSQEARTSVADNTINPNWSGQFAFVAYSSDVLEIEVKDKFSKSRPIISRFLGRLALPLSVLLERATSQTTAADCKFDLISRHPSDRVTGQLAFDLTIEKKPGEPWPSCLPTTSSTNVGFEDGHSVPGTPLLTRGSSSCTATLPNGNVFGACAFVDKAASNGFLSNGDSCDNNNGDNVPIRHRQLRQSDFEPTGKPKLSDRNSTSHSTWHGRTAARCKAESRRLTAESVATDADAMMTTSMYSNEACGGGGPDPFPPLPPKSNRPMSVSHRPSRSTKPVKQIPSRSNLPEDSFNFKIVDTDELERTGESMIDELQRNDNSLNGPSSMSMDANANVRVVHPENTPSSMTTKTADVVQYALAPLATPEQDTIRDGIPRGDDQIEEATASSNVGVRATENDVSASDLSIMTDEIRAEITGTSEDVREMIGQTLNETDTTAIDAEVRSSLETSVMGMTSSMAETNATSVCSDGSDDAWSLDAGAPPTLEGAECHSVTSDSMEDGSCASPSDDVSADCLPQCPPTPTHHASSARAVVAASAQRQARPSTPPLTATAGPSSTANADSSSPPPLPARHFQPPSLTSYQHRPTTRLPSIPERTVKFQRVELSPGEEPLPAHWEARIDSHGRIFYIDHLNRTTTWQRPSASQLRRSPNNEQQRMQLDRRYQSIRRTISSRPSSEADERPSPPPPPLLSQATVNGAEGGHQQQHQLDYLREVLLRTPAVRFVTRPEFLSILHTNADAVALYNRNSSLKHMIIKMRRDAHTFERYQHNRDLVTLLNKFADTDRELPRGWETKYDRTGKQFFIDHTSRNTTFIDPRLPLDAPYVNANRLVSFGARRRSRSAGEEDVRSDVGNRGPVPPPRPVHSAMAAVVAHVVPHVPTAYSDKVVAFLRQPNIVDILRERHPAVGSNQILKDKINCVRLEGPPALDRLSDDIDLIILLSLFEQEIMSYVPAQYCHRSPRDSPQQSPQASPGLLRANARAPAPYKRDFEAKLRNFYRKLESKGYGQGPGKLKINIRRDHLLEDAFNKIMIASKKDLQKSKLYVTFAGEEGLDYGGPSREFFFLLSRELFNPYYGLFEYSANDTYTVQVSPMSAFVDNLHEWFRFSGRVLGLALVHQYLLDAFFTRPFYKALLRILCSLSDLESLDAEFHQSLLWMKDNDITDILDLCFSVNEEVFGQVVEKELRPGGKAIPVTEKNKKEYIDKVVKWRLERGVAEQTESLVKGFYEVVDPRLVSVFDARELELVIAGIAEVDVIDWRKNTEYRSGYHDNHPVIHWFWSAIEKIDNERRLRLLQFVTGTSSIPYEGFGSLRGSNGPRKFCIEKWGKPSSLPRAHTCFNRLDLPPYPSFEMLYEKLLLAVEETSTFGIE